MTRYEHLEQLRGWDSAAMNSSSPRPPPEFSQATNAKRLKQDAVNSFVPDRAVRHYDILEWLQEQEKRPARDLPK